MCEELRPTDINSGSLLLELENDLPVVLLLMTVQPLIIRIVAQRQGESTVPGQLCGDERLSNSFKRFIACIAWREL